MNDSPVSASTPVPDLRVLPAVWKLMRLRLRITYNSFRHAKLSRKLGILILYLMLAGFGLFILLLSRLFLGLMQSPEIARYSGIDMNSVLTSIPALILSALFFGTLLTSFGVLLQALYLSGDMDFLIATPVPIRAVFIVKLLQAVLPNFALISLFGMPIFFGLGISNNYAFVYYPLVVLVMIVLALAAAGLASLLVMLVVRVLPPRRAAELLAFSGGLFGLVCSQLGNFSNSFGRDMDISGTRLAGMVVLANTRWLPLNWAGQGLIALGESHWLSGILLVGATLGFTVVTFWFALVTAERWYYSGWAGMQVITRKKMTRAPRSGNATTNQIGLRIARLVPSPVLGIVQKDFLTLRRDLRSLSQLISPIILGALYTLTIFRGAGEAPVEATEASSWFAQSFDTALAYSSVGMSLFVGWMILSRLAGMGFSQEGRNYWLLKAAPVRARHLLAAKFLVAYLPALGLGLVFLIVISIRDRLSALEFLYSLITLSMCQAGMAGILLSFGAAGANLTWDDPRRMNAGVLGCFGQIVAMLYLPISFGLFIVPLGFASFFEFPILYGYLFGLLVGSGATAICAYVPLWLVLKKVELLGE